MAIKIRPSRRGNFDRTGARLAELGVRVIGYDHLQRCYVDVDIPPGVEETVRTDPLIELVSDSTPRPRRSGPVWSSPGPDVDLTELGRRLRRLRDAAGLDLQAASALTAGQLSPDAIDQIEHTGTCDARSLIVLADGYGASLDRIAGRFVTHGSRRR